jgi:hypothetical protein
MSSSRISWSCSSSKQDHILEKYCVIAPNSFLNIFIPRSSKPKIAAVKPVLFLQKKRRLVRPNSSVLQTETGRSLCDSLILMGITRLHDLTGLI